jgi:hypothetical protein
LAGAAHADPLKVKVEVLDKTFDTAGGMLAYTEFELSGEPLAEGLGLDLDVLDPNQVNKPTAFDYTAGIESYEYSEEAMYAVNYQSRMGAHLVNGPVNKTRGASMEALGKRFIELAKATSFPVSEIPLNMYPITFPYMSGMPEYASAVDMTPVGKDEIQLLTAHGKDKTIKVDVPAYFRDYKTLAWREDAMDKSFNPAAVAGEMLKDVMWAQDFLGGMHVIENDEEVEAETSTMDQDGKHALGVSSADGYNGAVLTEITWDKLLMLRNRFGYDGQNLGAKISTNYDAKKAPVWFPHKVAVQEAMANDVKSVGDLKVTDGRSTLRDSWMMLWPLSEAYAFSDQRVSNTAQNQAFLSVFDGAPFLAAPTANSDADEGNNVVADDFFSLTAVLADTVFKNIDALHFDAKTGSLMDSYDGKTSQSITTYDAAYAISALSIYQRARDALPVGYASADAGESLNTAVGQRALTMIKSQADFILGKIIGADGPAADSYMVGKGASAKKSLETQFAVVRGLASAYQVTKDDKYKAAARNLFLTIEAKMYDKAIGTYASIPGEADIHTPWTAAAISSGLRSAMLTLRNEEGENAPALDLANLTQRYESWFRTVINGSKTNEGMQLAEWLNDSGENVVQGSSSGDVDGDNVAQVTAAGGKFGTAMVMAGKVRVSAE